MSYFDSCGNCEIDFPQRQYVFAWCENCLTQLKCRKCDNFMTMTDHRESLHFDECMTCFGLEQEEYIESLKQREIQRKAMILKEEEESKEFRGLSDSELESKWQGSADSIGMYAMMSWKKDISDEESKKYHKLAEEAQKRQSRIQKEITRRHD